MQTYQNPGNELPIEGHRSHGGGRHNQEGQKPKVKIKNDRHTNHDNRPSIKTQETRNNKIKHRRDRTVAVQHGCWQIPTPLRVLSCHSERQDVPCLRGHFASSCLFLRSVSSLACSSHLHLSPTSIFLWQSFLSLHHHVLVFLSQSFDSLGLRPECVLIV